MKRKRSKTCCRVPVRVVVGQDGKAHHLRGLAQLATVDFEDADVVHEHALAEALLLLALDLEVTGKILDSIADRVRELDPVAATLVTVGDDQQSSQNLGQVYVRLKKLGERTENQYEVMDRVRQDVPSCRG